MTTSYTEIIQKPSGNFADFVDRLSTAMTWQIPHEGAAVILLKDLAYRHSNSDSRKSLAPIKATGSVRDITRDCQDIGSLEHENLLAANWKIQSSGPCFACGRTGHCQKSCPKWQPQPPPSLCPKCHRGHLWASQGRSRALHDQNHNGPTEFSKNNLWAHHRPRANWR